MESRNRGRSNGLAADYRFIFAGKPQQGALFSLLPLPFLPFLHEAAFLTKQTANTVPTGRPLLGTLMSLSCLRPDFSDPLP